MGKLGHDSCEYQAERAQLRNVCRRGVIKVGTIDALVAQLAIRYRLMVLTTDQDFVLISAHCARRVWTLPWSAM